MEINNVHVQLEGKYDLIWAYKSIKCAYYLNLNNGR